MMILILVVIGVVFIGCLFLYVRANEKESETNTRLLKDLSRKTDFIESIWKAAEKDCDTQKARIDALKGTVDTLSGLYHNECLALQRVVKEQEFMKAHQHGMDKRIAGLKREVIVTINNAPEVGPEKNKKPTVTKSLLKRAGVTQ